MTDSKAEFWRDPMMDAMIQDIIDIFTNVEGVELVRLSGMASRARRISGKNDIPDVAIDNIIRKLYVSNVIDIKYITKCPHCSEISYCTVLKENWKEKPRLCDTCSTMYVLLENSTLESL